VASRNIQISLPSTGDEEWNAVREPLMSGWLTQGPRVAEFERAFADAHQAKHGLATTSCTTGLHLVLAAMGIGPGDEVIVPAFTWVATANVVLYCGATPVLADVDPRTFNISAQDIAHRITERTKAVIAVHLFGLCADVDAIRAVVPSHVPIIEDCACAAGATYKGRFAGTLGLAGVFSFHPRKSITTGEGGMVTTNDAALAECCDQLRNHGASISEEVRHRGPRPYLLPDFNLLGFNYRMTDLQGAVGSVQLRKLTQFIAERQKWAEFYREEMKSISWLRLPEIPENGQHAWQSFVTYVDPQLAPAPRNDLMEQLQSRGIATRPGTHAIHMLRYYAERYGFNPHDYPGAQAANDNSMAIPLHNRMTADDYRYVVDAVKSL
jgi:dTDP-4-amino-4,6-dideoxygalactose transaminase